MTPGVHRNALAQVKWVFFDLGSTLIDETRAFLRRRIEAAELLSSFGKWISAEQLLAMCEIAASEFAPSPFAAALEELGLDEDQLEIIWTQSTYVHDLEELYPGTTGLLSYLSAKYKLGAIANQSPGTEERLEGHGIRSFFDILLPSAELGIAKPDAAIFRLALREANCQPNEAVIVGDRLDNDTRPAKALGWKTVRVLQGISRVQSPRGPEEEPDFTVSSIDGIRAIL